MSARLLVGILWLCLFHVTAQNLGGNGQTSENGQPSENGQQYFRRSIFAGWSRNTSKQGFSNKEKDSLLTLHNELRKQVPAAGMRRLVSPRAPKPG